MTSKLRSPLRKIVSGGQTGVDRGALDAAIGAAVDHGGWCPAGRIAEDGVIPNRYRLQENTSTEYWIRTEQNVGDSDGTLILHLGPLTGGTKFTYRMTRKHRKPCVCVDLGDPPAVEEVVAWLVENGIQTLNVAGPRESSLPGIAARAQGFVAELLAMAT